MTLGTAMWCVCSVCIWDGDTKMNLKETSFDFPLNTSTITQE